MRNFEQRYSGGLDAYVLTGKFGRVTSGIFDDSYSESISAITIEVIGAGRAWDYLYHAVVII